MPEPVSHAELGVMECTPGGRCSHSAPGHALSGIRRRVSAATPGKWRDGLVREVTASGWIAVDLLERADDIAPDGLTWVWHHADLSAEIAVGDPVALHGVYKVLAAGDGRFSVLPLRPRG